MWRGMFLALGIFAFLLGAQCLFIDKAVLSGKADSANSAATSSSDEIAPPDWAPWSLMSAGAIVVLYSFTLPAKFKGGG